MKGGHSLSASLSVMENHWSSFWGKCELGLGWVLSAPMHPLLIHASTHLPMHSLTGVYRAPTVCWVPWAGVMERSPKCSHGQALLCP